MWTLWVVSLVFATADMQEYKYTRYAEFENKQSCEIAWYSVTSEFTQDEVAFCEKNS